MTMLCEFKSKYIHASRKLISQIQRNYTNREYYNLNSPTLHKFTSKAPECYKALTHAFVNFHSLKQVLKYVFKLCIFFTEFSLILHNLE